LIAFFIFQADAEDRFRKGLFKIEAVENNLRKRKMSDGSR
jgi:hypothetical protein